MASSKSWFPGQGHALPPPKDPNVRVWPDQIISRLRAVLLTKAPGADGPVLLDPEDMASVVDLTEHVGGSHVDCVGSPGNGGRQHGPPEMG